jgi:hypothetical protein
MSQADQAVHTGKWKVEMDIGGEWENVWLEDKRPAKDARGHNKERPKTKFATREDAELELKDHFKSMDEEGMDYDPDEYRIVPVIAN